MNQNDINETLKERGNRYGAFDGHAAITQALKYIAFGSIKVVDLASGSDLVVVQPISCRSLSTPNLTSSQQEALDMIFHKIGRILNGDPNYADSWHDIAGYATLVEQELLAKQDKANLAESHAKDIERAILGCKPQERTATPKEAAEDYFGESMEKSMIGSIIPKDIEVDLDGITIWLKAGTDVPAWIDRIARRK